MCSVLGGLLSLMSLSGLFNLASGGSLAAPPLISNCCALWSSEKVMEPGVLPKRDGGQKGLHAQEPHGGGVYYSVSVVKTRR